jgi:hypothetical protein
VTSSPTMKRLRQQTARIRQRCGCVCITIIEP